MRSLINTTQVNSSYNSAVNYSVSGGQQCYCLSNDESLLFVLDGGGTLFRIGLLNNSFANAVSPAATGLTGVSLCFHDSASNSLILLYSTTNSTTYSQLNLTTIATTNISSTTQYSFESDRINHLFYHGIDSTGLMSIYRIKGVCLTSTFYVLMQDLFYSCIANCATCTDNITCIICNSGYILSNSLCFFIPAILSPSSNQTASTNLTFLLFPTILNSSILSFIHRVPVSRKILSPIFFYMVNIDDFWLYQYHEREYGEQLDLIFRAVREFEK